MTTIQKGIAKHGAGTLGTLIVLLLCASVCLGRNPSATPPKNTVIPPWPVKVGYLTPGTHRSNSFSWYYIKEEDWMKEGWDNHVVCEVDDSEVKWMRLNQKDVSLKLLYTTNPDLNDRVKGATFYEIYSAGPYRVRLDYLQTNDPQSEDHESIAYDVTFTISGNHKKMSFKTKCNICE